MALTARRKPGPVVYSDAEMLAVLRRLADPSGTLGRRTFLRLRHHEDPSVPLYERRFGSWSRAVELAGLSATAQPVGLAGRGTRWSIEQLTAALGDFVAATGSTTAADYQSWRAQHRPDAPPLGTIRYRLGSWSHAIDLALQPPDRA